MLRYFPTQALNFAFKDKYKQMFKVPKTASFVERLFSNVAAGGAAGATSLLVVYPLDFARTRLAMDVGGEGEREFKGTVDTILKTAKESGWFKGGVYNGFAVSCTGIIIYRGAYFGLYDSAAPLIKKAGGGFWGKFLLGYAVTTVAGLAAYPIDTVRRRMMMQSGTADTGGVRYRSSMHAFGYICQRRYPCILQGCRCKYYAWPWRTLVLVGFDYFKGIHQLQIWIGINISKSMSIILYVDGV